MHFTGKSGASAKRIKTRHSLCNLKLKWVVQAVGGGHMYYTLHPNYHIMLMIFAAFVFSSSRWLFDTQQQL